MLGNWPLAMHFKRVDVTAFDPLRSLLHRRQHFFGGFLVIAQRNAARFSIRIRNPPPIRFGLLTNTPRSRCPLSDLPALSVVKANDRRAIGACHVVDLSGNVRRWPRPVSSTNADQQRTKVACHYHYARGTVCCHIFHLPSRARAREKHSRDFFQVGGLALPPFSDTIKVFAETPQLRPPPRSSIVPSEILDLPTFCVRAT